MNNLSVLTLNARFRRSWARAGFLIALVASTLAGATSPAPASGLLAEMLQGPLATIQEVVFSVRPHGTDGHWYANFGYQSGDANRPMYAEGGSRLCKLNLKTRQVTDLLADATGTIRDPQLHYNGKKILFSYRKGGTPYFHLCEINTDGTGMRQITDGPYDDIEPIYLPDGDLMFCSSRCLRWVQCWFTQVATLHRCDSQGRNIHILSANVEQDNTPWMMPDGRVLYMRWEYVDRSRVKYHHLWTMYPDGTGQMIYYGNQHPGTVMLDAKPIPGTDKVLAVFSPGHGRMEHGGRLTIVDPNNGPDDKSSARQLALGKDFPTAVADDCRDPFPVTENCVLFSSARSLYLTDGQGRTEEIYTLPETEGSKQWLQEPRPVCGHVPERIIAPKTKLSETTGYVVLQDIYHGRNMDGVKPGEIKKLLVMETLPKPINHSGTMEPISYGGTFTLPRILGTVPVEPDGSANIELPALRSLFFIALDENNLSVKRMQSFLTVMPGETLSCVGCHESRADTARPRPTTVVAALKRPPSQIEPLTGIPEVFDFPRDIQPILDLHCVGCHNYEKPSGKLFLTGDRGPIYSHAYVSLMSRGLVSHGRDADGNKPPRGIGSSASKLMGQFTKRLNKDVTTHEVDMIRLWIDSGAPYAGNYAALGTGMVRVKLDPSVTNRCGTCHSRNPIGDGELAFNLTTPEKSLALLAPLAKAADGYGQCTNRTGEPVYASTQNADYLSMLDAIRKASAQLNEIKRFDMAGFKPGFPYVREMKRYRIVPSEFNLATDMLDVYATDRAYWRSLWWKPMPNLTSQIPGNHVAGTGKSEN
ncbi:MAG: hypothetical protein WCO56_27340 [Verrucomicrobiota bacterium]